MTKSFSVVDQPNKNFDNDFLGIDNHAQALTNFIKSCQTPLTVGIQGEWGSGKTSLLNSISHKLGDKEYKIITINAWEQALLSKPEETLLKIVNEIINNLTDELSDKEKYKNKISQNFEKITKGALRVAGAAIGGNATAEVVKDLMDNNQSVINDLKNTLKEVTLKIVDRRNYDKIVIYVDDLDRIDPPDAVSILELLKNIFDIEHCVFVLAIDYQVVVKGLEKKFGKRNDSNEWEFKAFFDKIIQLPFMMPIGQYDIGNYVQSLLQQVNYLNSAQDKVNDVKVSEALTSIIEFSIGGNPRSLKRLVNSLSLIQMFMDARENKDQSSKMTETEKDILMFAIVCMQIQYPDIYEMLSLFPNFKSWDDEAVHEITDGKEKNVEIYPNFKEDKEAISVKDLFDEDWEQALYSVCYIKERYRYKVTEISKLLNFIDDVILKEKNDLDVSEAIREILSETSITSVASKDLNKNDRKPFEREYYEGFDEYLTNNKNSKWYNADSEKIMRQLDKQLHEMYDNDPHITFVYTKTGGLTLYYKHNLKHKMGKKFAGICYGYTESQLGIQGNVDRRHFVSFEIAKSLEKKHLEDSTKSVGYMKNELKKYYQSQSRHTSHMYEVELVNIKDFDVIKSFLERSKNSLKKHNSFARDLEQYQGHSTKATLLEKKIKDFKNCINAHPDYNDVLNK
jgi:ABC-type dipeptide/oligopeptide/nickel transport system ATPase subunit